MIKAKSIYEVASAVVPLYVAMFLGFGSVRWWNILKPDQCSGVNQFVSHFSVPFLIFSLVSTSDLYAMNLKFVVADSLQKVVVLVGLFVLSRFSRFGSLDWSITLFSIFTLPNTFVVGVPLLKGMYGEFTTPLMAQIVTLQLCVWVPFSLILFEFRAAKLLIQDHDIDHHHQVLPNDDDVEDPNQSAKSEANGHVENPSAASPGLGTNPSNNAPHVSDQTDDDSKAGGNKQQMASILVMTKLTLIMAWKKLIKTPNIWASILGLIWSLVAFRFHIKLPAIVEGSITILSNTVSGMAMFSLGTCLNYFRSTN
ncbi:hypothetical protein PIB30_005298 [Stylosanthes scabra]|uniref:Auxin efflux carrier component n=1 Tax=Stylosanthes scabra TaxID=79078 RepID=A0ABU6U2Q7_9FABA|nr:hypothetical protein [Stylosanthes scabra]